MSTLIAFVTAHQVMVTLVVYWFFSAIVSGMPTPKADASLGYQWAFASLHSIAGSVGRVMATKFPGMMPGGPTPTPPQG